VVSLREAATTTDHCVVTKTGPRISALASEVGADWAVVLNVCLFVLIFSDTVRLR